jgi:hypothetical protein
MAERLCVTNPQAAVEGLPWPPQPEPLGLWDHAPLVFDPRRYGKDADAEAKKGANGSGTESKGFWNRLFAR